jgi:hypothetical protein
MKMRLISKAMKLPSKISWGTVWIFCCVSILQLGLGTFLVESDGSGFPVLLMVLLILLSFPSGLVVFLLTWPLVDISPPLDFILVWSMVFLAGYFQWFEVVSNLRGAPITLSLQQIESVPQRNSSRNQKSRSTKSHETSRATIRDVFVDRSLLRDKNLAEKTRNCHLVSQSPATPTPNTQRQRKQKRPVRIVHFDAAGRTPLERAIDAPARKSSQRYTET